jgi:hypothetical protein
MIHNSYTCKTHYEMNIKGLDYNTGRDKLIMPEYGREVQRMVEYAISLPNKQDRQRCAQTIVNVMMRMQPQLRNTRDFKQKIWEQLAIISNFKLDIDWPFDVKQAETFRQKPEPMTYQTGHIPVRHYGKLVFELFDKLKEMPEGPARDRLTKLTANQMKRDLVLWGHSSNEDEKVASDLARFTDGKIQLDLNHFKFAKVQVKEPEKKRRKR